MSDVTNAIVMRKMLKGIFGYFACFLVLRSFDWTTHHIFYFLDLVVIDWILIQQKDSYYLLESTDIIDMFDCRASYFCSWFCQAPLLGHHLSLCCSVGLVLLRKQNHVQNLERLEEKTYVEIGAI